MLKLTLFTVLLSIYSFSSQSKTLSSSEGEIYELGSEKKKLLFKVRISVDQISQKKIQKSIYKNTEGQISVIQKTTYDKNGEFAHFEIEQKQLGEQGTIRIEGDQIIFSYKKQGGKEKISKEKKTDNFIIGQTMVSYLQKNWQALTSGKTLSVRFGVPNRLETVGFDYKKVEDKTINNEKVIVVKMSASSWLIAQLVDPIYFTFRVKDKKLIYQKGRVIPKTKRGSSWDNLDAETYYQ